MSGDGTGMSAADIVDPKDVGDVADGVDSTHGRDGVTDAAGPPFSIEEKDSWSSSTSMTLWFINGIGRCWCQDQS